MICRNPRAMLALWLLLLAAALLSACGEKDEPDPGSPAAAPIVYVKTGGIAGIGQEARIAPQGDVTASLDGEAPHPVDIDAALVDRARTAVPALSALSALDAIVAILAAASATNEP